MERLIHNVGYNDVDYRVYDRMLVNGKEKILWTCPFYVRWKDMLRRCYSKKFTLENPTYEGCSSVNEWHKLTIFKDWMERQDWQGKQLDKDILFPGNKIYSPNTCVFVDRKVNQFINEHQNGRGEWPIGVSFSKALNKFQAGCMNIETGKRKGLGYFDTPEEAHQAWLTFKLEQAKILASQQTDERVAKALIYRYTNYTQTKEEM